MNFIIFMPDEMRAESVSCYGHPLVRMPNYDRLAAEGVRFDQCHVQHTVCTPSRCSMMTGWYPHVSGHRTLWHLLRPHEPSLFRYLRKAGYHVEWWGKNDLYSTDSFSLCVDSFASRSGPHAGPCKYEYGQPGYYSFLNEASAGQVDETGDMQNVMAGMEFLRSGKSRTQPFCLYLPLTMPHPTYAAPRPYHDMYSPDEIPALRNTEVRNKPCYFELIRKYRGLDQLPDEVFRKIQAVYLGMNSYMDRVLGELLQCLDETGHADDTAVFVMSDHGDWAGDWGLVEKWPSGLDDTLTRVPFIARVPGGKPGHVVNEQVEMFDLMATILELAGIRPQHTHFARSLVPQINGKPGDPLRAVFAEGGYDPHEPHCFEGHGGKCDVKMDPRGIYYPKARQQQDHPESVCRSTMIRTLTHKLVRRTNGEHELYDLQVDWREMNNLYGRPEVSEIQNSLEQQMLDWYLRTADTVPLSEDPRGLPGNGF